MIRTHISSKRSASLVGKEIYNIINDMAEVLNTSQM
mgnify:FL=1